jgi:hypothetical protein
MTLFHEFHKRKLLLLNLNFGMITLVPKQKELTHIRHFHHICLLNVRFKILTKVAVNRITGISEKIDLPITNCFHSWQKI